MALPLIPILAIGGTGLLAFKAADEIGEGLGDAVRIAAVVAAGYVVLRYGPTLLK